MTLLLERPAATADLFALASVQPEIELSIVMPCLNEAETLARCIAKARAFLERTGTIGEIIVADNGSTDGSREIARAHGARVIAIAMRGYGAALFGAMSAARGRYCIMGDSDDSYDFGALDVFLEKLRDGHDLVMGNRFDGGIAPGAMPWKNRYIGNPVLSGIGRLFFVSPIRDFHCGLRGLSKAAFQRMDLRTTGMEYASEMVIKATLLNMRIAEVPTTLDVDGRSRRPHLRPYRDGWRHLRFMLLFSPNWLFLYPGLMLMATGLLGGGILLMGPVKIAAVRFSLDTLLYCSAMIGIGFQAILFAILSRSFAIQEQLVPRPRGKTFILDAITLERGLLLGCAILGVGAIAAARAILLWRAAQFGELDVERISRVVIASSLALSLGAEIVFSSFLLSILKLNTRSYPVAQGAIHPS
jgi:glycosyltransferase involved in cell wall biosynthesis